MAKFAKQLLYSCVLLCVGVRELCLAIEIDLTVYIEPGTKDCFHQFIKKGTHYEVEFQTIEGGDLDLNFLISSPTGRIVLSRIRSTEVMHKAEAEEEGDFKFCLDNSFSRFSRKMVFFELMTDDEEEESPDYEFAPMDESMYEVKLDDVKTGLESIKSDLEKSREILRVLKAIESRDRSIQESNFERVNFWSSVQLFIMVSVSLVQVLMIRSLFEEKRTGPVKMQT